MTTGKLLHSSGSGCRMAANKASRSTLFAPTRRPAGKSMNGSRKANHSMGKDSRSKPRGISETRPCSRGRRPRGNSTTIVVPISPGSASPATPSRSELAVADSTTMIRLLEKLHRPCWCLACNRRNDSAWADAISRRRNPGGVSKPANLCGVFFALTRIIFDY